MKDYSYSEEIRFLLELKLQKLKRDSLPNLTFGHLERTVMNTTWKKGVPHHLSQAAADVAALKVEDIVNYLTRENLVARYDLGDLVNSLEGDTYEKE